MTDIFDGILNLLKYMNDWPFYYLLVFLSLSFKPYRNPIYWGILGVIINSLLNIALKGFFKVPLPPYLHIGYAYPSGHMQTAIFIYSWLAYNRMFGMRYLAIILLPGIAYSLNYFHFHTYWEILAGFICGGIYTLYFLYLYQQKNSLLTNLCFTFSIVLAIDFLQAYEIKKICILAVTFILLVILNLKLKKPA